MFVATLIYTAGVMLRENSRLSMMFQLYLRTMIFSSRLGVLKTVFYTGCNVVLPDEVFEDYYPKNMVDSSVGLFKLLQSSSGLGLSVIQGKVDCLVFITVMCTFRDLHSLVPSFVQLVSFISVWLFCLHPVGAISVVSSANSIHFKSWLNLTGSVFK